MTEPTEDLKIENVQPHTLTGAQVYQIRESYGLSRKELALMCGFPGTGVRISNIEKRESWKEGDREKVYGALVDIQRNPPRDKKTHRIRGETGSQRAEHLDARIRARARNHDDDAEDAYPEPSSDVVPTLYDPDTYDGDVLVPVVELAPDDGPRRLTNSEVGTWLRCRRKWWLSVYRGLTSKQQDFMGPRAVGARVHRALAAWYVPDNQERTDPREALERAIVEDWTAIVAYERTRPSYIDDESLADLSARFNEAVSLERAMVEGYMEWVIERGDDMHLRVTAPETILQAEVKGNIAGEDVVFRPFGLIDVRVTRMSDGTRLYVDHKTVGNFAAKQRTLHMDPQMLHYHLLEFLNTPEGEARCDGALYNMIRRVKRSAQAKGPFYQRVEVHHNAYEIDAYRRRLLGAARDIMRAERELNAGADHMSVVYPTVMDDCSWSCEFFTVCPMHDDGSRVDDAIAALYDVRDPMARYDLARNTGDEGS